MKKYLISILLLIVVLGGVLLIKFYKQNLQGVRPAISDPASREASKPGSNSTGIPLVLPAGFSISLFSENVPGARVMVFDMRDRLLLSQTKQGTISVLTDENKDGKTDSLITLADNLQNPHGLALECDNANTNTCILFVAEEHQVSTYTYTLTTPALTNKKILFKLPDGGGHYTRTLLVVPTPEGKRLLTSIGSSCNVCIEEDAKRAAVYISKLDGTDLKPYATGLRNSVFMTLRSTTTDIWATEMGRDLLGDNTPPDEVNILKPGKNYGWPYCYGKNIHDTKFDRTDYSIVEQTVPICDRSITEASHIDLQAHSAPLGLAFIPTSNSWPVEFQGDLLIAYHGSWNRSVPTGYKIVRHKLTDNGEPEGVEDFITGFLKSDNKSAYGRPADLVIRPDGTLFISDDHAGLIYQVSYDAQN